MKRNMGFVIILIETASIGCLLFLMGRAGLPKIFDVFLVFCLPITFGLHVFEEFIFPGGGIEWFALYHPEYTSAYTPSYFFKVNVIALVLSILTTLGTFDFSGGFTFFGIRAWIAFLAFQAINAIFHLRGSIVTRRWSPGLGTGILLYLPLTIVGFTYLLRTGVVDMISVVICIAVASCIQPVLDAIKKSSIQKQNSAIRS
ncbi:MAG TPA: HXXEE domain-containing protein [Anaerolineaceae bacterium]|nr:HXXEE domain-containing protein [Anaerolineaceae bacterium]